MSASDESRRRAVAGAATAMIQMGGTTQRPGRRRGGWGALGLWLLLGLGFNAPRQATAACAKWCSARGKCVMDTCYCLDGFSGSDCSRHEYMVRPPLPPLTRRTVRIASALWRHARLSTGPPRLSTTSLVPSLTRMDCFPARCVSLTPFRLHRVADYFIPRSA